MDKKFTKLSELVDSTFTVERVAEYRWKMWDAAQGKMLVSENYEKGYKKVYTVETDKGLLDLTQGQLANILEAVSYKGEASLPGKAISVKSNGKSGIDIRYFFNQAKAPKPNEYTDEERAGGAGYDPEGEGW